MVCEGHPVSSLLANPDAILELMNFWVFLEVLLPLVLRTQEISEPQLIIHSFQNVVWIVRFWLKKKSRLPMSSL